MIKIKIIIELEPEDVIIIKDAISGIEYNEYFSGEQVKALKKLYKQLEGD